MDAGIEAIKSSRTFRPKTFLAFYATILGIVLAACLSSTAMLAITKTAVELIPLILCFAAVMVLLLVGGVFAVMLINPSKVMLTQVSGTEYVEIQRAVLGDSRSGKEPPSPVSNESMAMKSVDQVVVRNEVKEVSDG